MTKETAIEKARFALERKTRLLAPVNTVKVIFEDETATRATVIWNYHTAAKTRRGIVRLFEDSLGNVYTIF